MQVQVFNENGDTIRTFHSKIDTGMVRIYWGLNRDGVRFPSHRETKPDDDPPGGPRVLPGRYKLVLSYGDNKDSTYVNVKMDPRSNITLAAMKAEREAIDEFYQQVEKLTTGFDRLKAAQKTIKLVNSQLVNAPDSTQKAIKKLGAAMQDSIKALKKIYMLPRGLKGIQRTSDNLTSYIWQANGYLNASDGPPNQMARFALKKLQTEATKTIEKVNQFFDTDWKDYRKEVEAVKAPLFKDYEAIDLSEE